MIAVTKHDEVYSKIEPQDKQGFKDLEKIQTRFSFYTDGYQQNVQYKSGAWDGKESFIRYVKGNLYVFTNGLMKELISFCECMGIQATFPKEDMFDSGFDVDPDLFLKQISCPLSVREYQKKYFSRALKMGRCCMIAPTGSGKTLITHLMCEALHRVLLEPEEKILVLVPRVDLVKQTAKKFRQYGCSYGVHEIFGGQEKHKERVTVSTWQSIYTQSEDWFSSFAAIIIDECHSAGGENVRYVAHCCKNARFRIGMTGTLKDDVLFKHLVQAYLGPIYQATTTMELVSLGFLSQLLIKTVILDWCLGKGNYINTSPWAEQQKIILSNEPRFEEIIALVKQVRKKSVGTTMVLGNRVEYLRAVHKRLKNDIPDDKVHYITGTDVDTSKRTPILDACEKEGGVLVANLDIVGTGTDIPNVDTIIIVTPVKAKISLLQLIGRGVRLSPGKKILEVYDVVDKIKMLKEDGEMQYNFSFKHLEIKQGILENENFVSRQYVKTLKM